MQVHASESKLCSLKSQKASKTFPGAPVSTRSEMDAKLQDYLAEGRETDVKRQKKLGCKRPQTIPSRLYNALDSALGFYYAADIIAS